MPIPTPHSGESEDDFISRCMGDPDMQEFDQDQRAAVCYDSFRERAAVPEESKTMKERRKELQRKRAGLVARMQEIVKQEDDAEEGTTLPDDLVQEFAALRQQLAELDGRLQRLEDAEAAEMNELRADDSSENGEDEDDDKDDDEEKRMETNRGAVAFGGGMTQRGYRVFASPRPDTKKGPGFQLARYVIGLAQAKWNGREKAAEFIMNRFQDEVVARALNTTVVAEGGALIPQDFMADLIELLRAAVVVREAQPMTVGMPMGNLTIPRLAGGSTAVYQGELDDISLSEEQFDDLNLIAKKLTAMVPISNDLIRRAPIGVEQIVRDDLVQGIARKEDITFLRSDGSGQSPVGFRSLVLPANLITIPAGATLDVVVDALSALILTLQQGLSRMLRPHWFMAPALLRFIATRRDQVGGFYYKDEVAAGSLEGIPFSTSQQIPTNLGTGHGSEIYLVDMADVVIADTLNIIVDASDVAAYYGTDGKIVSTFQRDQSLFRVISEHDINMRHLQSLAVGVTSDWQFAGLPGVPGQPWSTQPLNPHWARAPAAWPAAATHDAAPTIYDPATVGTSAFAGTLTHNPGGGPYPLAGQAGATDAPPPPPNPPAPEEGGARPPRGR